MENLLVGHVKLIIMFVQIKFANHEELSLDIFMLWPLIGFKEDSVKSSFME